MNIEKEREAFEAYISTKLPGSKPLVSFTYIDQENKYRRHEAWLDDPCWVKFINDSWEAWQASALRAEAKLEGCVVVSVELNESIAEKLALEKVDKPRHENDAVWQEIADRAYKDSLIQKKWEIIRNYKELVEAARGGNE
ncbi:hypothetical protein F889_00468 [Acinetobacter colistiniresistens]|uniref:Uncharacterized protein n=1 Tax=Acinetobacter colistiniresistens TaxID=280145 RepID=N9R1T5_9GAMM|nr:hypothetical protein [Acinetobacter colistiniresistens]ENX36306.1 hypothetical protein F889_00468 [Acinetobacter colistiniresistens]